MKIKVSIVEDNPTTLKYLEALLSGSGRIEVVGAYSSGTEALRKIPEKTPDVLIVDLGLPDISGIDVIKKMREQSQDLEILVLTMHENREHLFSALKAGATGYLLKGTSSIEIIKAIEEVSDGGVPMSPRIARYIIEEFQNNKIKGIDSGLTSREKEVLKGISEGLSEKELADKLLLSSHTIHTHIKNIYRKLHVRSRIEAILKAKKKGII